MATDNFNNLSILLSRKIFDPVAAVGTDGTEVTSALRTDYLNRANRFIQAALWSAGKDVIQRVAPGLVKLLAASFHSTNGQDVPSDYVFPVSASIDSPVTPLLWFDPSLKPVMDGNLNPNMQDAWTSWGGHFWAYVDGAGYTGAGKVYYIQSDQVTVGGTDIALDSYLWECLLDIAASYHFQDKGELNQVQASVLRWTAIMNAIRSNPNG